jgi:hypothetical protein
VDADLKDAIIYDENLSTELSKGKAKNVPPAVKNKKELREKVSNTQELEVLSFFSRYPLWET